MNNEINRAEKDGEIEEFVEENAILKTVFDH
jgi:hypothetical protein